jgi:hypothetical protein
VSVHLARYRPFFFSLQYEEFEQVEQRPPKPRQEINRRIVTTRSEKLKGFSPYDKKRGSGGDWKKAGHPDSSAKLPVSSTSSSIMPFGGSNLSFKRNNQRECAYIKPCIVRGIESSADFSSLPAYGKSQFDQVLVRNTTNNGTPDLHDHRWSEPHVEAPEVVSVPETVVIVKKGKGKGKEKMDPEELEAEDPKRTSWPISRRKGKTKATKVADKKKAEPDQEEMMVLEGSDTAASTDDVENFSDDDLAIQSGPSSSAPRKKPPKSASRSNGKRVVDGQEDEVDEGSFDDIPREAKKLVARMGARPKPGTSSKPSFIPQPRPTADVQPSALDSVGASKFYSRSKQPATKPNKLSLPLSLPISGVRIGDSFRETCQLVVSGQTYTIQSAADSLQTVKEFKSKDIQEAEVCLNQRHVWQFVSLINRMCRYPWTTWRIRRPGTCGSLKRKVRRVLSCNSIRRFADTYFSSRNLDPLR